MTDVIQEKILIGKCANSHDIAESSLKFRYTPDSFKSVWDFSDRLTRFVASYYSLFPMGRDYQSLLFIINEIIENAIKNTLDPSLPIEVEMCQQEEGSTLIVTNEVSEAGYRSFMEYVITLNEANLVELYRKKLEDLSNGQSSRGIGLILLKKDYHVDICFEFSTGEGRSRVSVRAHL